jgi:hypothetical protein
MLTFPNLVVVLSFAYAFVRLASRLESVTSGRLKWWQRLVSVVALMMVVLIAANPEFWALGLLGDTAFLDLFVLLMCIQMQMIVFWAWSWSGMIVLRGWRWLIAPSPYLLGMWMACIVTGIVSVLIGMWKGMRRMVARAGARPSGLAA